MQESTARVPPDKGLTIEPEAGKHRENDEPKKSELEQVAALFRGEDGDTPDERENAQESQAPDDDGGELAEKSANNAPPKSLDELAEKLGIKTADLYALEIGQPGESGKTITLGELKDLAQTQDGFQVEQLEWEEKRAEREAELMRSMGELQELVAMLPKSAISQDLLRKVATRRAQAAEAEERATLRVIPDWRDGEAKQRDLLKMSEHLARYGFPANYAESIVDHRTLFFIRESMLREQRIKRALGEVSTVRKPGHATKPSSTSKPPRKESQPRRGRGHSSAERGAVAQVRDLLLNG